MESVERGFTGRDASVWYGAAEVEIPPRVVAGSLLTWRLTYVVGRYGVDQGGRLLVAFRAVEDFDSPQTCHPAGQNYLTVSTTGDAELSAEYEERVFVRPWFRAVCVRVRDGYLREGDRVVLTFGDSSGGGPGQRMQTMAEANVVVRVLVECFETGIFEDVPTAPSFAVVSAEPERLVAIVPSQVRPGESFRMIVKAEDRFGNPVCDRRMELALAAPGLESLGCRWHVDTGSRGVAELEDLRLAEIGSVRFDVMDGISGLRTQSNPLRVTQEERAAAVYWADIHGQTEETIGLGTQEEYFRFARDVAALDIVGHQGNDFELDQSNWERLQRNVREFYEPNRFVTLLGYEWSATHPAGGDRSVYFGSDVATIHRTSHWKIQDKSDLETDRYPVTALHDELRGRDVFIMPHVGGRPCNMALHDATLEPVVEICSTHGRFEWLIDDVFKRGYRVGFTGNSDDHSGRIGATYPSSRFRVRGGLTGVLAHSLTREAVIEAYRSRRVYATTGERIILDVTCDGHSMGEEVLAHSIPWFEVDVAGTAPLWQVQMLRGSVVVYEHSGLGGDAYDRTIGPLRRSAVRLRLAWGGARAVGRSNRAVWNGGVRVYNGSILEAEPFAFDALDEGIQVIDEEVVKWASSTVGDLDGVVLTVEASSETRMEISAGPLDATLALAELRPGKRVRFDAGGIDLFLSVELEPTADRPECVQFAFGDEAPLTGINPYWVRVVQTDGEMAWSSPIFVEWRNG